MSGSVRHTVFEAGRTAALPAQIIAPGDGESAGLEAVVLSLDELVRDIRSHFGLRDEISDDALLLSLRSVTERSGQRARWLAIFGSPLGAALAARGTDVSTAFGDILAALPPPRA